MMEAELRNAALVHSDECATCNQRLRDEQALTRGLRALASKMDSLSVSSAIESRLRAALTEEHETPIVPPIISKPDRRYWLAIAAGILLFVATAIAINWQRQTKPVGESNVAGTTNPEPVKPQEHNAVADNGSEEKARIVEPRKRQPRTIAHVRQPRKGNEVVSNHAREIATDFMPLGYVNSASLQDGGHIVRVELPRSALVRFGLPVNMDRMNEKVKADVWLGVDGLAHAIRFVQ
jgi:hypothetical protein